MISKVLASRRAVTAVLFVIAIVNVFFIARHEAPDKILNSKESLDKMIDKVMSDEYASALKDDLVLTKEAELMEEVKAKLKDKYKNQVIKELKDEYRKAVSDSHIAALNERLERAETHNYFSAANINGEFLGEFKKKYYQEHKDSLRDSVFYDALGETALDPELRSQVEAKLKETYDRKPYLQFVLQDIIQDSAPKLGPLTEEERGQNIPSSGYCINPQIYNLQYLSKVQFSHDRFKDFKTSHTKIVDKLRALAPPPSHVFSGRGIIISGGGTYMAGALVAILQAREAGSKLPIELIINDESEYDPYVCKEMSKKFNFRCLNLEKELGKDLIESMKLQKFQLKIIGLLASSFDEVISLDADNMALKNPDELFQSTPYIKTGFVLWPDMWHRAISPVYYNFAGFQVGEVDKRFGIENEMEFYDYARQPAEAVHFHDLAGLPSTISTETGQMVFSKTRHYRSLILALYYNVFGESHYWRLFHQGSPGDGDRETFVPALHVFDEPYYVVERATWLAGFQKEGGGFQETTIVQYDPQSSWEFGVEWRKFLKDQRRDSRMWFGQDTTHTKQLLKVFEDTSKAPPSPEVFFLHVHRPKINPVLSSDPGGYYDWSKQRNQGLPGAYNDFGSEDWELKFYTIGKWVACEGIKSEAWWKHANREQSEVCKQYTDYVEFLKQDSQNLQSQELKNLKLEEAQV